MPVEKKPNPTQAKPPRIYIQRLKVLYATFLALALFDALIGGAIAALLQIEGFTAVDQRLNNVYQLGFGFVIAATGVWLYFYTRLKVQILALAVLLFGFVEDSLFYLLVPLLNPVIRLITQGAEYAVPTGGLFPERISGWLGWVGRMLLGRNLSIATSDLFILNGAAVVIAALLLMKMLGGGAVKMKEPDPYGADRVFYVKQK